MKHGLWPLTAERMQISGEVSGTGSIVVSVRAHVLKRRLGCAKAVGRSAPGSISYFVYFVLFCFILFRLPCVWSGKVIRYRGCITPPCEHGAQMVRPGNSN